MNPPAKSISGVISLARQCLVGSDSRRVWRALLLQVRSKASILTSQFLRTRAAWPPKKMTMGLIVGNRGFFPDHLAKSGREEVLRVLGAAGIDVVALTPEESKYGAVETREESRRCADLFRRNRDRIDGVIVTLPNFAKSAPLPILCVGRIFTSPSWFKLRPTIPPKMTIAARRDAFAGKCLLATTCVSTASRIP